MQTIEQTEVEQVGGAGDTLSVDAVAAQTVDAGSLHETLADVADTFDVTGFKCIKCTLAHMHDTTKHRLSDSFDIDEETASQMDYNSVCHCGLQEAGRHGGELGIDEADAARKATRAPIPPEASREMNEQFGTL